MDKRLLIQAVRRRPALWDQTHPNYHNRDLCHKLWTEVANQVQASKDAVQRKWKCLRDVFRRELRKMPSPTSGPLWESTTPTSTWVFFNEMLFLKDFMGSKLERQREENTDESSASNIVSEVDLPELLQGEQLLPRSLKRAASDPLELSYVDDDLHFFLSVLPYVRTMPVAKKLFFRMKVQQLLYDTVNDLDGGGSPRPPEGDDASPSPQCKDSG